VYSFTYHKSNQCDLAKIEDPAMMDKFWEEHGFVGWYLESYIVAMLTSVLVHYNRLETSARDDINLNKAVHLLVSNILARFEAAEEATTTTTTRSPTKCESSVGSCCVS